MPSLRKNGKFKNIPIREFLLSAAFFSYVPTGDSTDACKIGFKRTRG
jgi:hypothetical protein